ncbi:hypothetical protein NKG94_13080 [Micromonospora sp. M12]
MARWPPARCSPRCCRWCSWCSPGGTWWPGSSPGRPVTGPGGARGGSRWPALIAVGGVIGSILANVVSNLAGDFLSELAANVLGPATIVLAVGSIVGYVVYEVRRRRAGREVDLEPTDVLTAPNAGAPNLPYTAEFTGRGEHVDTVVGLLAREHAVAVLGRRAVGTSACAVEAANRCREDFPDGQYYLDLRRRGRPARLGRCSPRWPGSWAPRPHLRPTGRARRRRRRAARSARRSQDPAGAGQRRPPRPGPTTVASHRAYLPVAVRRRPGAGRPERCGRALDRRAGHVRGGRAVRDRGQGRAGRPGPSCRPAHRPGGTRDRRPVRETARTVRALGYRTAQHGWRHPDVLEALRRAAQTPPHQRLAVSPAARLVTERDLAYRTLTREARRLFRVMSLVPAPVDRPTIAALAGRHPSW